MYYMLCATQYAAYIEMLLFITATNATTSSDSTDPIRASYLRYLLRAAPLCSVQSTPADTIVTNHLHSDRAPGAGILLTSNSSHIPYWVQVLLGLPGIVWRLVQSGVVGNGNEGIMMSC